MFVYDRRGSGKSVGEPAYGEYGLLADNGLAEALADVATSVTFV